MKNGFDEIDQFVHFFMLFGLKGNEFELKDKTILIPALLGASPLASN